MTPVDPQPLPTPEDGAQRLLRAIFGDEADCSTFRLDLPGGDCVEIERADEEIFLWVHEHDTEEGPSLAGVALDPKTARDIAMALERAAERSENNA